MASMCKLTVELEANMARFQAEMTKSAYITEQAMSKMQKSSSAATEALKGLAAGAAAGFSMGTLVGIVDRSTDALAKLDDMAQKTGSSVENLSKLSKVASAYGANFDEVDAAMTKLAKGMNAVDEEGSKVKAGLDALGISTKDLKIQDPSETFVLIARKLQEYKDGAGKAALMTDVLGKSGANLLPYMNDVAESLDKFSSDSNQAAAAASAYQDQLGELKVKHEELVTTIVGGLLPPMTDLVTAFNDSKKGADGLASTDVTTWADSVALGVARVVDVAKVLPGLFSAIQGSFKVVMNDAETLGKGALNLNPGVRIWKMLKGEDPAKEMQEQYDKRNKDLLAANQAYSDLWNKPADGMVQSVLASQAARRANAGNSQEDAMFGAMAKGLGVRSGKKDLPYSSSTKTGGGGKSDAEKLAEDAAKFIAKLKEEAETYGMTGAALVEYQAKQKGFSETVQTQASVLAKRIDLLKLEDEVRKDKLKAEEEYISRTQQNIAAQFESIAAAQREAEIYDMLPAAITRAEIAKLELHKATLEANQGTAEEIRVTEALIAAKQRLAGAQDVRAGLEEQKKVAEEAKKIQDNFVENIQRNLGSGLFDMLDGNFRNIGDSFKKLIMQMVADAAAANITAALFGNPKQSGSNGLLSGAMSAAMGYFGLSGARANGGPVMGGSSYLVGERGPEIFTPGGSGAVIPNSAMGRGGLNVNITNNAQAQVEARPSADGNGLDVIINAIKNSIGEDIAYGTGSVNGALQSRYGLRAAV